MGGLRPEEIALLAGGARITPVARGAVVPLDGPTLALVEHGWFRLFRNAAFARDVTLVLAGPGELLAPGALFGDRSAESGAQAIVDGRLLVVAAEAAGRRAAAAPRLYAAIAGSLTRRAARIERKLEAVSRATVEERVAGALLEVAAAGGTPAPNGGVRLELPLSQSDLAGLAGTTRESCSTAVAAFARRGLVRGSRLRGLLLTDPPALAKLAAVDFPRP